MKRKEKKTNGFVIAEVMPGKLNALVKNLMHQMDLTDPNEAVRRINSGEWALPEPYRQWRERYNVIYFSVTSDGTSGPEWVIRLEKKGVLLSDNAKNLLRSPGFTPTTGVTTRIAVLKGALFTDSERVVKVIHIDAYRRGLIRPNAEVACLIREKFSDEEIEKMVLEGIITMHNSLIEVDGGPDLLGTGKSSSLRAYYGGKDDRWHSAHGFAFVRA